MADIIVMKAISSDNDAHATEVRRILDENNVIGLNFLSSPGAGKTTLLVKTIQDNPDLKFGVIEGDVFTSRDSERIEKTGAPSVQLNTEGSCHLTAAMVEVVLPRFDLTSLDFLVVENIGNLICPSAFRLGAHKRIVLLSTPEGSDKVLKYPQAFNTSDVILVTKMDIADAVSFDMNVVLDDLKAVNPNVDPWPLSVVSGEGLERWYGWLRGLISKP